MKTLHLLYRAFMEPLFHKHIRYGVVANIVVSHTTAGGSIPPIGVYFLFFSPVHVDRRDCVFIDR